MSDKTEAERRALPWYDPEAIPRAESDATHCRHPDCHDTNWGGRDRIHTRGEDCPPLPTSAPQPAADTEELREALANADKHRHEYGAQWIVRLADEVQRLRALVPAADTETDVQWGVRGVVAGQAVIEGPMSKFQAEGHLGERGASTFRTSAVVRRTATYTPWEEA